jgi:hypothetical protein
MKIVVFTDQEPTKSDSALIAKFENSNHRVLVDSIHKNEINWLVKNYDPCPHRVYFADSIELYDGIVRELDVTAPFNFIAYFDEKEVVNNADWVYIRLYLKALLYDEKMPRITRRLSSMLNQVYTESVKVNAIEDINIDQEPCYTFKKAVFEDRNIALCEIVKPIIVKCEDKLQAKDVVEKSVPYTIVVRNFATRGYYPIFWSLFICDSWGKDNKDIQFLKALWSDLNMEGEFNMDEIIDNGIKECNWGNGQGACAGPEVYRKGIDETLQTLLKKEQGLTTIVE